MFLELPYWKEQPCYLTKEQQGFWVSRILLPALQDVCPPHLVQHHPRSWEEALGKAKSLRDETVRGKSNHAKYLLDMHYYIPAVYLEAFWDQVLARLEGEMDEDSQHRGFAGLVLLI